MSDLTNNLVRQAAESARLEVQQSPQVIQSGKAIRAGGGSSASLQFARVIEAPTYPEPPADPVGRPYYTVRLVGTSLTVWALNTDYEVDDIVVWPDEDSPSYKCKIAHRSSDDILPTDTGYWEKLEDIRVEYALGHESPPRDLRQCSRRFDPGAIVEIISRTLDTGPRYYIPGIFWCGEDEDATIRVHIASGGVSWTQSVFM